MSIRIVMHDHRARGALALTLLALALALARTRTLATRHSLATPPLEPWYL